MLKTMKLGVTCELKGYSLLVRSHSPKLYAVVVMKDNNKLPDIAYVSKRLTHQHGLIVALKRTSAMQLKEKKGKLAVYTMDVAILVNSLIQ